MIMNYMAVRIRIQLSVRSHLEKTIIRIECLLDKGGEELLVKPTHIDSALIQPAFIDKVHLDNSFQISPKGVQFRESVLHNMMSTDLHMNLRPRLTLPVLRYQPLKNANTVIKRNHMRKFSQHNQRLAVICCGIDSKRIHFETALQPSVNGAKFTAGIAVIKLVHKLRRSFSLHLSHFQFDSLPAACKPSRNSTCPFFPSPKPLVYILPK
mmetsp:Transcript_17360/g.36681  ORF Transcript_17360/g.36681 Transcript_17360/m.36681 type:complete len:210 (-) Transcript_17360:381-1010(-)